MESKVYARLMETDALLEIAPRVGQRRIIVWRVLDGGQSRATVAAVVCAACAKGRGENAVASLARFATRTYSPCSG